MVDVGGGPRSINRMKVELEKEEVDEVILMMEGSTVRIGIAEKALALLKKFKEAK